MVKYNGWPRTNTDFGKYRGIKERVLHDAMNPEYANPALLAKMEEAFTIGGAYISLQMTDRHNQKSGAEIFHHLGICEKKTPRPCGASMDNYVNETSRRMFQAYLHAPQCYEEYLPDHLLRRRNRKQGDMLRVACTEFCLFLMAMGYDYRPVWQPLSQRQREEATARKVERLYSGKMLFDFKEDL